MIAFADMMRDIQAAARTAPATEVLAMILDKSGYRTALEAENTAESDARLENLAELAGSIGDYEAEAAAAGEPATLEGFLERVSLQADTDSGDQGGKITLMTVHGAKGLEFDTVLLTGMEEEMFPYRGFRSRWRGGDGRRAAPGLRGHHARAATSGDDAHRDTADLRDHALGGDRAASSAISRR